MPVDLLKQIHPVYGGAIGFGVWFAFQLWRAWKEYRKELREAGKADADREKAEAEREVARRGRLDRGFGTLDESRDRQIKQLTEALEADRRRHQEELERMERRLAAKARALEAAEADRERGWDLARECHDRLHGQRHDANGKLQEAYGAGKYGRPLPAPLPEIPPLHEMAGKRPE